MNAYQTNKITFCRQARILDVMEKVCNINTKNVLVKQIRLHVSIIILCTSDEITFHFGWKTA